MDLVRAHVLRQIGLRLSAEGRGAVYLAQDRANGKIFVLRRDAAAALRLLARSMLAPASAARDAARASTDDGTARVAIGALQQIHGARLHEQMQRKPFNPIFAALPLFDVGPWQRYLGRAAAWTGGWPLAVVLAGLVMLALWLGVRNDWQIMAAFGSVFSLQAILTFGLIAPLLKIVHELGHVLAATRHGVRVRKAGLYLIGLYPMPFVDCTQADVDATRAQRIAISGAGIVTDVLVGLVAFIAWHLTGGDYLSALFANIFVFSALNSVLFNGNPLIKLDGYYVLCDVLGQRNLASRAALHLRDLRRYLGSFGRNGARPQGGVWALIGYGIAAFGYRIYIFVVIAFALLPAYLGLGALVLAWGGVVMFVNPLMRAAPPDPRADSPRWHRAVWALAAAVILGGVLAFVRLPIIAAVPVALDSQGSYQITAPIAGRVQMPPHNGPLRSDGLIAVLDNPAMTADAESLQMDVAVANQLLASLQGGDPARALVAAEQLVGMQTRLAVLTREIAALRLQAAADGLAVPVARLDSGAWVAAGAPVAYFYPAQGASVLTGAFPEHLIATAANLGLRASLRLGRDTYVALDADDLVLREIISFDRASGSRSLQISVTYDGAAPMALAGQVGLLRLRYDAVPLWTHAAMLWNRIAARFREAQISDQARHLN